MRVLLIEDEPGIAGFIKEGLEEETYAVDVAYNGKTGVNMAQDEFNEYDIILLDWMLPGFSGIEVLRKIRQNDSNIPVIFLTARDTTDDAVFALDMGASDYIKKPFSFDELLARIRVQLRESDEKENIIENENIRLNLASRQAFVEGQEINLTQKEFALMEFLLRNTGHVCSRTRIIQHVWDIHFDYDTSVIDVYINALRKKIAAVTGEQIIDTVRGAGYIIRS